MAGVSGVRFVVIDDQEGKEGRRKEERKRGNPSTGPDKIYLGFKTTGLEYYSNPHATIVGRLYT